MISIIDKSKISEDEFINRLKMRNQIDLKDVTLKVNKILDDVRTNGDEAVINYSEQFDKVQLTTEKMRVSKEEIQKAYDIVDKKLIDIMKRARDNIYDFHKRQISNSWMNNEKEGEILGQIIRPLENVGIYSPGGTAAYPSSVLMNAVTAKTAGVKNVVMLTPPKSSGVSPAILVAADIAKVDEIYCVGGAQAIGALAFGTKTIPKVDKIVGPGNIYVNTAKRLVYGYCDIDMFAGPSEILIIADDTADPAYVAADLISQAEHDVLASSILVTNSDDLIKNVLAQIEKSLEKSERKAIIEKSFQDFGAIIKVNDITEAIAISNQIAPEHLELCINDPFSKINSIKNAGAIFVGNYSPEPLGDYFAGPNHVLPTSGTARFFSPLNVDDFVKKTSVIYYEKNSLAKVKDDIIYFAQAEGLKAHADAVDIRFKKSL